MLQLGIQHPYVGRGGLGKRRRPLHTYWVRACQVVAGWLVGLGGGCMRLPMMKAAATSVVVFAEGKEHRWARFDRSSTVVSQGIV